MEVPDTTHIRLRVTEIRASATSQRTFIVAVQLTGQRFEHNPYVHPTVRPPSR